MSGLWAFLGGLGGFARDAFFREPAQLPWNRTLAPNSNTRGFPAPAIEPNAALPKLPLGSFKGGVFDTLKTSARNSRFTRSAIRNVSSIIKSAACSPGPRTGLRELVPIANCGADVKAVVLKYLATLRPSNWLGSPIRLGL